MGRPKDIILPKYRPRVCAECPLCGKRPKEEMARLEAGNKWTHICVYDDRLLSGRGTKQPDARNRCSVKKYRELYFSYQGKFPISPIRMERYGIQQQRLLMPPSNS